MTTENDEYVLGTNDEELQRLGLQHRVWRPRVLDAWRRAGFNIGQTILDLGCGPGYATVDLLEIVGPDGRVISIDKSQRFLSHLRGTARQRGFGNLSTHELDLDSDALPEMTVDGAWCRWVLAFLTNPRRVVEEIARVIRPGGVFVSYEYFAYDSWRFLPPSRPLTDFVRIVSEGWRSTGGEPDIGLCMPGWLSQSGFEIESARPLIEVVRPGDYMWQWPKSFVAIGTDRYVDLGVMTRQQADEIVADFHRRETDPRTMMITPGVLEVIARRV